MGRQLTLMQNGHINILTKRSDYTWHNNKIAIKKF